MRQADTDVRSGPSDDPHEEMPTLRPASAKLQAARKTDWIGEVLGEWQRTELRIARGFAECRGLSTEQLEDIYQETALALLSRPYGSEEHLRNALRHGIKHRALNMHRDTRRRAQILAQSAPTMQRIAESRESQAGPEEAALAEQDRLIVREFLTELDELEQRVFWLIADGMRYRAIASALQIPVNEARNASRSCERKRERFQLLYDTGRLCGYRAATIQALQAGEVTTDELAQRAFAHLEACASCRAEHKINAKRLGRSFKDQVVGLLPVPAFKGHLAWLGLPGLRAGGRHALRRVAAAMGTGGAGAKLAVGITTVAVIAGGTLSTSHVLEHPRRHPPPHTIAAQAPSRVELVHEPTRPRPTVPVEHGHTHWRRMSPRRQRSSGQVQLSFDQRASETAPQGSAEREFSPEAAPQDAVGSGPTNQEPSGVPVAAAREFGLPAPGG
jgi:RNA polymerase sigma factor (sigma-70 family)